MNQEKEVLIGAIDEHQEERFMKVSKETSE